MDRDEFSRFVKQKVTANFNADGFLASVILALVPGKGLAIATLSGLSKDESARLLQKLRSTSPLLAMVAEAWLVDLEGATPEQREQALTVQPSEHPQRKEVAFVTVYEGLTMVVHSADIVRPGGGKGKPRLGSWKTIPMTEAEGRLVTPPPEWN